MKLLMIIGQYYPIAGGAEKECQKLSQKLLREGFEVAVLTQPCEGVPDYEVIDGIPVYRQMKGWHWFEFTYMLSVFRFLLQYRENYDIIQCFGLYLFIPPALIMKYLFGKKVIARLECAGRYGDFWRINQLRLKKLVMGSTKRLDNVIYISKDIQEELIENNFPDKKMVHITNTVNVDRFKPPSNHKPKRSKSICFVGRLEEQKGLEYLIRAIAIVCEKDRHSQLFVVGDGQMKSYLQSLCEQLQLHNYVFFVGSTDDVLAYYQAAHFFVLPSISEGLPLSLLEALSCGLPVIATAIGGNREILDPHSEVKEIPFSRYRIGKYGVLVNPGDVKGLARALLRLFNDESLTNQLRKTVRTYIQENYALDKVIGDYRDLYSELVGNQ